MPLVTVVLPTWNRAVELDRCLTFLCEAIVAAGVQNEVAVAIVDSCSSDQTRAIADRHVDRTPWCRYFRHFKPCRTAEESLFQMTASVRARGSTNRRSRSAGRNHAAGAAIMDRPVAGMLQEYGLTTSMALISRYVFRRQQHLSFADYIRVSRIYSHVFGLPRMWRGQQVLAVKHPLVARLCGNGAVREYRREGRDLV